MTQIVLNWLPAMILLVLLVVGFLLMQTKYKKQVASILLFLVTKAEIIFGSKTGELKYSAVSTWVYERLPFGARLFITNAMINTLIEEAVVAMNKYLENNAKAKEVIENARKTEVPTL